MPVVHFEDVDVPIIAKPRRRLGNERASRLTPSDVFAA